MEAIGSEQQDAVAGVSLPSDPTETEMRTLVRPFKQRGICGRRVVEQHIGPALLASPEHDDTVFDLLERVVEQEYDGTELCVRSRSRDCLLRRGGCKGDR